MLNLSVLRHAHLYPRSSHALVHTERGIVAVLIRTGSVQPLWLALNIKVQALTLPHRCTGRRESVRGRHREALTPLHLGPMLSGDGMTWPCRPSPAAPASDPSPPRSGPPARAHAATPGPERRRFGRGAGCPLPPTVWSRGARLLKLPLVFGNCIHGREASAVRVLGGACGRARRMPGTSARRAQTPLQNIGIVGQSVAVQSERSYATRRVLLFALVISRSTFGLRGSPRSHFPCHTIVLPAPASIATINPGIVNHLRY
jgi:hypothetical protein